MSPSHMTPCACPGRGHFDTPLANLDHCVSFRTPAARQDRHPPCDRGSAELLPGRWDCGSGGPGSGAAAAGGCRGSRASPLSSRRNQPLCNGSCGSDGGGAGTGGEQDPAACFGRQILGGSRPPERPWGGLEPPRWALSGRARAAPPLPCLPRPQAAGPGTCAGPAR